MCSLYFHFGGGWPLYIVYSLIFQILKEDLTVCLTISSQIVFPKILPDVLSFLRCSCFFKSQSFVPLMPSSFAQCLFLNICPFWVLGTTFSLPCPWQQCPLHCGNGTVCHPSVGGGQLFQTHRCPDLLEIDFQQGITGCVFTAWVLWGFTCVKESLIVLQIWYLYTRG